MIYQLKYIAALIFSLFILAANPSNSIGQETGGPIDIDEEFSFNVSEFEKSPLEFGGYLQLDASYIRFQKDSALYRLNFFDQDQDSNRASGGMEVQPEVSWQKGSLKAYLLANLSEDYGDGEWEDEFTIMEGNLSWQINPKVYVSTGKTLVRWGKGYAWNPVNFVGRDKNPSDPDLALEGYWMGLGDVVFSFPGSLRTLAVTAVVIPVDDGVNEDFGVEEDLNWAGKVYLLLNDTDIDFMTLSEGSRTAKIGVDISSNVNSNFEIHGEWALVEDYVKPIIASDGARSSELFDAESYLLGVRYLTPTDMTFIVEYYHNGLGYTEDEAGDFYDFIDVATDPELAALRDTSRSYQRPNYMQDYIYLRASQKEPFGLLYLTPVVTSVFNLDDSSYNIIPEIVYTGVTNLELRFRLNILAGDDGTEYGEKQNHSKAEVRARYFF